MAGDAVILAAPGRVILVDDVNDIELAVAPGISIPANTRGLLICGSDGTNPRYLAVDASGNLSALPLPTGAATETTVATLATETKLEAVRVLMASLDGKDYATETTQATLATEAKLEAVRVLMASLDGKDFATETTLAAADVKLGTIDGVLDAIKDTDGIKQIVDPVAVTDNDGSLTVDGPLTDTELRAAPVDSKDRIQIRLLKRIVDELEQIRLYLGQMGE